LFLGLGYYVNILFNFGRRQMQAVIQGFINHSVRVSLFNRYIVEKALSQIYVLLNMEHIFSAKSLQRGNWYITSFQKATWRSFFIDKRKASDCNSRNSCWRRL